MKGIIEYITPPPTGIDKSIINKFINSLDQIYFNDQLLTEIKDLYKPIEGVTYE